LLRLGVYGREEFDDKTFKTVYHRHIQDVKEFFSGCTHRLLIMDITKGDGYEKLAPFLEVPTPLFAFPHTNKTTEYRTEYYREEN